MHPFIRCPTCGTHIGSKAEIFRRIRAKRMLAAYGDGGDGVRPSEIAFSPGNGPDMKDVLDRLKIRHCCRIRLISHVSLSDKY